MTTDFTDQGVSIKSSDRGEQHGERGAVLLEWAIVAFGLFVGFITFYDLATMLGCYLALSQVAYEGAKLGACYPNLEQSNSSYPSFSTSPKGYQNTNNVVTAVDSATCLNGGVPASHFPCGHNYVQDRIRYGFDIVRATSYWNRYVTGMRLTTRFVAPGEITNSSGGDPTENNTVIVTFTAVYNGLFFRQFPITATVQTPYLM